MCFHTKNITLKDKLREELRKHCNPLTLQEQTINKLRTKRTFIIGSSENPIKEITKNHNLSTVEK